MQKTLHKFNHQKPKVKIRNNTQSFKLVSNPLYHKFHTPTTLEIISIQFNSPHYLHLKTTKLKHQETYNIWMTSGIIFGDNASIPNTQLFQKRRKILFRSPNS